MIRLEIGLEIRSRGVMRVCSIQDKTAVVFVASYIRLQCFKKSGSFQGPDVAYCMKL